MKKTIATKPNKPNLIIDLSPSEIKERQELTAKSEEEKVQYNKNVKYKQERQQELSFLDGEGMDAIRKEIAAIRAGLPETDEYTTYKTKVEAIKNKHPKPVKE